MTYRLSIAAHHLSFVQCTEIPKRALWHRARGLRLMNERLANPAKVTDPANILPILTMALLEVYCPSMESVLAKAA